MFQVILNWAEVWALVFPLVTYLRLRHQPAFLKPVIYYLWGAFVLNLVSDIIGDFEVYLPGWMQQNLILYNIHSLFRFVCFIYFFNRLEQRFFAKYRQILLYLFILAAGANAIFLENFFDQNHINGNLFTLEAYFLLIHCLLYYLGQLREDVERFQDDKAFWVVTGLSIYVVLNFFIFLFYVPMIQENSMLADRMWSVHNLAYIILCLFITKAIYVPVRSHYGV
ncbi:hypothetical protein A6C57_15845 [Fibrella sp. ES10-3-2-2]|nr:hypothetical protein A6C57_15845 [Fibrella sp. ES10-3-2-2]